MNILKSIIIYILTIESKLIIAKYKPFIVAVTGSVGKTSAKDAIYCVLKDEMKFVRKSAKSMNSDIGLPLTIIGVANAWYSISGWYLNIVAGLKIILSNNEYPECLILEIGADHPNDIKQVAKWLHPDIVVITKISSTPVHVEYFKSPEEVFEEKAALAMAVKSGGTLVLICDDENVMSLAKRVENRNINIVTYGTNSIAKIYSSKFEISYVNEGMMKIPVGISFNILIDGKEGNILVKNILGRSYQYPILAAASVGLVRGIESSLIVKRLNDFEPPNGRMRIIKGINDSILLDDSYNSSPDAVMSAIETLKELECSGVKIAALGDMLELGKYSADEHRQIGKLISNVVSRLVTVGPRSKVISEKAVENGLSSRSVSSYDDSEIAAAFLKQIIKKGDVILIKGSQSTRMEKMTRILMREVDKSSELLVRQEKEWLEKK